MYLTEQDAKIDSHISFVVWDFVGAGANRNDLDRVTTENDIISAIEAALPSVSVTAYGVSDDISATIEFEVDADEATNDLTQAAYQSEEFLLPDWQ